MKSIKGSAKAILAGSCTLAAGLVGTLAPHTWPAWVAEGVLLLGAAVGVWHAPYAPSRANQP